MPNDFEKLSEREIQRRLYGDFSSARKGLTDQGKKPKQPIIEKKEEKPPPPPKEISTSSLRLVGGFTLGILAIFLFGFFVSRFELPSPPPKKSRDVSPKTPLAAQDIPYTIQVMVYENRAGAEKVVESLQEKGFPAYIKERTTSAGKLQLRIYVGEFSSEANAKSTLAILQGLPAFKESFIRKK